MRKKRIVPTITATAVSMALTAVAALSVAGDGPFEQTSLETGYLLASGTETDVEDSDTLDDLENVDLCVDEAGGDEDCSGPETDEETEEEDEGEETTEL